MEEKEIWKDIEGYEGLYQVSNMGRVRSIGNGNSNASKPRILKTYITRCGYVRCQLYKNNEKKQYLVHVLMAKAFLDNPNNLPQVNHIIEECKDYNVILFHDDGTIKYSSLEWCDASTNINYGTRNKRVGNKLQKIKESKPFNQYTLDGEFVKSWKSLREVYRVTGKNMSAHILDCLKGRRKTAYGYMWEYAA